MKIDWKHLASTAGYKSLMKSVTRDVQDANKQRQRGHRPMRDKEEFMKNFRWVINRAIHYSHHTGRPIHEILNDWESKRDYWWLNYYKEGRQPKLNIKPCEPMGIRGYRNYLKRQRWGRNQAERNARVLRHIQFSKKESVSK